MSESGDDLSGGTIKSDEQIISEHPEPVTELLPPETQQGEKLEIRSTISKLYDDDDAGISLRPRKLTEKGSQYRIERLNQHFKAAVTSWRKQSINMENLLTDCKDSETLRTARDQLDTAIKTLYKIFEELEIEGDNDKFREKLDSIEENHYCIMKRIGGQMKMLEGNWDSASRISRRSRRSMRSMRSSLSNTSSLAAQKAAIAADAASLRVELNANKELAEAKAELDKLNLEKQLKMAEARFQAVVEVEKSENLGRVDQTGDRASQVLNQYHAEVVQPINRSLENAPVSSTVPVTTTAPDAHVPRSRLTEPSGNELRMPDSRPDQIFDILKTLTEQTLLSRLPSPEPGIFSGDPIKFPAWINSFETLVELKGIPKAERLYYLKKYVAGPVREAIEGHFILFSGDSYEQAKRLLKERYGNPFVVYEAFRSRLDSWPKISTKDGSAMRKFSDFLKQCELAMKTLPSLNVLNDQVENRKMLQKLPDWIVGRWGREVAKYKSLHDAFPPFKLFVRFLCEESDLACDPVVSIQSLRPDTLASKNSYSSKPQDKKLSVRALAADAELDKPDQVLKKPDREKKCIMCQGQHSLDYCQDFIKKLIPDREKFIREKGLCFGCLIPNHISKNCRRKITCRSCKGRHPNCLHKKPDEVTEKPIEAGTSMMSGSNSTSCCTMIVPVFVSSQEDPDHEILVYALLDTQSDTTFVTKSVTKALRVTGTRTQLRLSTLSVADQLIESEKYGGLLVRAHDNSKRITLPVAFSRDIIPASKQHVPTPEVAKCLPHLQRISEHLLPLQPIDMGLLIGYNCPQALLPHDVISAPDGCSGPYAQRTDLGWSIIGGVSDNHEAFLTDHIGESHHAIPYNVIDGANRNHHSAMVFRTSVNEVLTVSQISSILESDFIDHKSEGVAYSQEDQRFIDILTKNIVQDEEGHYTMPLPFRSNNSPMLPDNRHLAESRVKKLRRKLLTYEAYNDHYVSFMKGILAKGHAERVPDSEVNKKAWYLPHHGVYHPKKPNKLRVVFDASSRYQNISLNDNLLQGPDLMNNLIGVLLRFRRERVAVICDIEQMFHQFRVIKEHQDYLRFLWWDGDYNAEPSHYRMKVHLFGASSSPGCANFGLKQIASDHGKEFGFEAANFIQRNFYVDDGLTSVPSSTAALNLIENTKGLCAKGMLRLHKIASNSKVVMDAIPIEDRTQGLQGIPEPQQIERTLGIQWSIESDCFQFRIVIADKPLTRRGVLSIVSSIYDPLGFIAPYVLEGKRILQMMCRDNVGWDERLPADLEPRWLKWISRLHHLEQISVQRSYIPEEFGEITNVEIHHFSDASTSGYGQCSYLRLIDNSGNIHCSLLAGKSRVSPLKIVTIPRLELTASVVSVKMSSLFEHELDYQNVTNTFWTDSRIVLGYISNETRRFHVFIANRVQLIQNQTKPDDWHYIPTDDNPADDASRGLNPEHLRDHKRWFRGPDFLWQKKIPYFGPNCGEVLSVDPEVAANVLQTNTSEDIPLTGFDLTRLEIFSSWHQTKRAIALCLRLRAGLRQTAETDKKKVITRNTSLRPCTVDEISGAEREIIRHVQRLHFPDEMKILSPLKMNSEEGSQSMNRKCRTQLKKKSSLYKLYPFLDDNGLLRVGGRISRSEYPYPEIHPVILPKPKLCHISMLIIRHFHNIVHHQGRGMTINQIRSQGFWIIGCVSAVANYIHACVQCRKLYSGTLTQKMAELPKDRIEDTTPFSQCGVDYFGPWIFKEGRKELKRHGVVFTCLVSRAVHLETANSLSTDSFLNALRRFLSIRGPIRLLRSDQGTNFVGAENELQKALAEMNHDKIHNFLSQKSCDYFPFKMNSPSASHAGGVWERQIRSVRRVMKFAS